jgi:hypothetical protein
LRGEFLRAADEGRGVDPGREIGTAQLDALQNITGSFIAQDDGLPIAVKSTSGAFFSPAPVSRTIQSGAAQGYSCAIDFMFDASRVARTGKETRGRNLAYPRYIYAGWPA